MSEVNSEVIKGKMIAIIADKLNVDAKIVTEESSFTDDLGSDSLDTVELIMEFEKEFDIKLPDDQAEGIKTVGQAMTIVIGKVQDKEKSKPAFTA